jgi:hypothetical protein
MQPDVSKEGCVFRSKWATDSAGKWATDSASKWATDSGAM